MLVRNVFDYRDGFPREGFSDSGMGDCAFELVAAPFPDVAPTLAAEAGEPQPSGDDQAI